ncbi:MAG: hypothetical protein AMR96_07075 [Candidatus Adiutrix intracellularis]|nr:MAG: hypothetical protein AMR96_07075 [Candidatus Adiutrix intracellularis]
MKLIPGLDSPPPPPEHILEATSAHFTVTKNGRVRRMPFPSNLGQTGYLLMLKSAKLPEVDNIFMEITNGNRYHKDLRPSIDKFLTIIIKTWQDQGKILIQAFAIEQTQELLLLLDRTGHEGHLPKKLTIIPNSPLVTATLTIYSDHQNLFNPAIRNFLTQDQNIKRLLPTLHITRNTKEIQALNDLISPIVIITGSDITNAGRILHHLKHNLWQPNYRVISVKFQVQTTANHHPTERVSVIIFFREPVQAKAQIHTIGGFSEHTDQKKLLIWLRYQAHPKLTINLIHSEPTNTRNFYELIHWAYPKVNFYTPIWLNYVPLNEKSATLKNDISRAPAPPPHYRQQSLPTLLLCRPKRLCNEAAAATTTLPPDQQLTLLENCLTQAESLILIGTMKKIRI